MTASALGIAGETQTSAWEKSVSGGRLPGPAESWNPERFAQEQIRSLVRRVFARNETPLARQVVLSALEPETDSGSICLRIGATLASETEEDVAVAGEFSSHLVQASPEAAAGECEDGNNPGTPLREGATPVTRNLWLLRARKMDGSTASVHRYLDELRREFAYSIVQAPSPGSSHATTAMAQLADGIILVLSAQRTRRVAACRVKDVLEEAHVRLLGTVLTEREFPIPEGIYRRL